MKAKVAFLLAAAIAILTSPLAAEEPANYTFSPAPPGTVVQNQLVYLTGEAMHSQWRAVASKKLVGTGNGTNFYQWYLSIYAIDGTTYRLKYQSPANGGPLSAVTQVSGGDKMWFPVGSLHIVGAASLTASGVQQLVVQSHEMSADCGGATVSVFTANAAGKVVPAVSVRNGCELTATIVHRSNRDALVLAGPYYGPNAAMCCPTKPKTTAALYYVNGSWVEKPKYYEMFPGKLPPT